MKPKWPETYAAEEMELPENARIAVRGDAHQLGDFVPRGFLSAVSSGQPARRSIRTRAAAKSWPIG